jgi:hypothetical protein
MQDSSYPLALEDVIRLAQLAQPLQPPKHSSTLSPLVQPHPAPRLHRGCLDRGVSVLQTMPEGNISLVGEPGVGLTLQGGELRCQVRQLSGKVVGGIPIVSWSTHASKGTSY